ncbi:MAG: hypothetical protein IJ356_00680 [Erysipelotrichaceae bacterium]|nr:hypothetical protein [Erysipelotrichaceae bacterium]
MKTVEKLILCCIWICIAIVGILIKDQVDLNERIIKARTQKEIVDVPQILEDTLVVFQENDVMEMVSERMPEIGNALLEFREDGIVEISLEIDDKLIQEAQNLLNHELVSAVLPMLKGTSIGCEASLSAQEIELIGCKAGVFSVPVELLSIVEEKLNETWRTIVESHQIQSVEIDEQGLKLTVNQE